MNEILHINRFLTAGDDGKAYICQVNSSKCNLLAGHSHSVQSAHFNSDGTKVVTSGFDKKIIIHDLKDLTKRLVLDNQNNNNIQDAFFVDNDKKLMSVDLYGFMGFQDAENGNLLQKFTGNDSFFEFGKQNYVEDSVMTQKGQDLIFYDIKTGQIKESIHHTEIITSIDQNHDRSKIVLSDKKNNLTILNLIDKNTIHNMEFHKDSVIIKEFSKNRKFLITADMRQKIAVWDADTGKFKREIINDRQFRSLQISNDSTKIVITSFNLIIVYEIESGNLIKKLDTKSDMLMDANFNDDDSLIVSGSEDGNVKVWDVKKGICLHEFEIHHGRVNMVEFSPKSKLKFNEFI